MLRRSDVPPSNATELAAHVPKVAPVIQLCIGIIYNIPVAEALKLQLGEWAETCSGSVLVEKLNLGNVLNASLEADVVI